MKERGRAEYYVLSTGRGRVEYGLDAQNETDAITEAAQMLKEKKITTGGAVVKMTIVKVFPAEAESQKTREIPALKDIDLYGAKNPKN